MSVDVIVANLNKNFTGVTATLHNVVPHQLNEVNLAVYGPSLGYGEPHITAAQLLRTGRSAPIDKPFRIWHARRNTDLWRGIFYRDVLKMPLKILFTSAAQRQHSALPRWLIQQADAVIATTEKAAKYLYKVDAIIPHGIDLSAFSPPDHKPSAWQSLARELGYSQSAQNARYAIGQLGRIRPQKGTDIFVDALIKVLPDHPDAVGVITGTAMPRDKQYKKNMTSKIHAAGLDERIIWAGQLSFKNTIRIQQSLSIFVAAARREEFGLTPAEALACGTPIICSNTGAFALMVKEGITGHLLTENTPANLASVLNRFLATPEQLAHMQQACREHAEHQFAAQREAAEINQVYRRLWQGSINKTKG